MKNLTKEQRLLLCKQSLIEVYERNGVGLKETMRKYTIPEIQKAWDSIQGSTYKYN